MESFWLSTNREQAAYSTLFQLMGKLQVMQAWGKEPTCEELLKWIEATLKEEESELDKKYPNKARWKGEESA